MFNSFVQFETNRYENEGMKSVMNEDVYPFSQTMNKQFENCMKA